MKSKARHNTLNIMKSKARYNTLNIMKSKARYNTLNIMKSKAQHLQNEEADKQNIQMHSGCERILTLERR